jgi:hypothetical protein
MNTGGLVMSIHERISSTHRLMLLNDSRQLMSFYFHARDDDIKCFGSVFAFIGDHPELAEIARTTHPPFPVVLKRGSILTNTCVAWSELIASGLHCCRLCDNHWDDFKRARFPVGQEPQPRDPTTSYEAQKQVIHDLGVEGKITAAKETLKENGWGKHLSPTWELEWVRVNFYKCFGVCSLHLLSLGIAKVPTHTRAHRTCRKLLLLPQCFCPLTSPFPSHLTHTYSATSATWRCGWAMRTHKSSTSGLLHTPDLRGWSSSARA